MSFSDEMGGPVGVGGWMYLFLVGFAVVSPLTLLFGTYVNLYSDALVADLLGDNWLIYQIFEWLLVAVSIATIAYITWRLFNLQNPATVRQTIIAIPTLSLGILFADAIVFCFLANFSLGLLLSEMTVDIVRGFIYCGIWCSYFMVSKRVNNTYHTTHEEELGDVFQ